MANPPSPVTQITRLSGIHSLAAKSAGKPNPIVRQLRERRICFHCDRKFLIYQSVESPSSNVIMVSEEEHLSMALTMLEGCSGYANWFPSFSFWTAQACLHCLSWSTQF